MDDPSSLLLSAIEETERLAQAAEGHSLFDGTGIVTGPRGSVVISSHIARYVEHNDPSSVLRRCAADRRTVERHSRYEQVPLLTQAGKRPQHERYCLCCRDRWPCPDLLDRAEAYGLTDHQEGEG